MKEPLVLPALFIDSLEHPTAKNHHISREEFEAMQKGKMTMLYVFEQGVSSLRWKPDHYLEKFTVLQPIAYNKNIPEKL